jgi:hypothetical protein
MTLIYLLESQPKSRSLSSCNALEGKKAGHAVRGIDSVSLEDIHSSFQRGAPSDAPPADDRLGWRNPERSKKTNRASASNFPGSGFDLSKPESSANFEEFKSRLSFFNGYTVFCERRLPRQKKWQVASPPQQQNQGFVFQRQIPYCKLIFD